MTALSINPDFHLTECLLLEDDLERIIVLAL